MQTMDVSTPGRSFQMAGIGYRLWSRRGFHAAQTRHICKYQLMVLVIQKLFHHQV
jgi:hypothetical protein